MCTPGDKPSQQKGERDEQPWGKWTWQIVQESQLLSFRPKCCRNHRDRDQWQAENRSNRKQGIRPDAPESPSIEASRPEALKDHEASEAGEE
jgi:hypothetical protein